ncbi:MAG: AAA family ATPase [Clostridia bacterium]|nr:AAA family ATPase [Clostridia bacterium]
MQIKIVKMAIKNFKGIKDLEINFDGKNMNIYGDNATGKTTIFDAFLWVLFDKNSAGKSEFGWKPFSLDGTQIHFLESTVELVLEIDENRKSFKKTAVEKWVKKRGNTEQVYEGNETNYWIDEVPTKASEFSRYIDNIMQEQKFKMITNPLFFNAQMTADEQRTVLSSIAELNNISDEQIMKENEEFTALCEKLNGRSVNDYMKIVKETIKKLNEEIKSIPVRIDELNETMIIVDERELKAANDTINACEIQKNLVTKIIGDIKERRLKNEEIIASLAQKQREIEDLKALIYDEANNEILEKRKQLVSEISKLDVEIQERTIKIQMLKDSLQEKERKLQEYRDEFDAESKKVFKDENNYICPVCNREYEESTKSQMLLESKNKFEAQKADKLGWINGKGRLVADFVKTSKANIETEEKEFNDAQEKLQSLKIELENLKIQDVNYENDRRYIELNHEIEELKVKVDSIVVESVSQEEERLKEIDGKINDAKQVLMKKESQITVENRIEKLKNDERNLAIQIQEQEYLRDCIEEFTKNKITLLETKINENFELVKFKLFENQINGGVKDVCYATVDGVPYSDLNSAMKINAGLDVIRTLMRFYNVQAPIFIDNKETINNLIDIDTQIISLIVSNDKKLRMEVM